MELLEPGGPAHMLGSAPPIRRQRTLGVSAASFVRRGARVSVRCFNPWSMILDLPLAC